MKNIIWIIYKTSRSADADGPARRCQTPSRPSRCTQSWTPNVINRWPSLVDRDSTWPRPPSSPGVVNNKWPTVACYVHQVKGVKLADIMISLLCVCVRTQSHWYEWAEWRIVCWEMYLTRAWKVENISVRTIYRWKRRFIGFLTCS